MTIFYGPVTASGVVISNCSSPDHSRLGTTGTPSHRASARLDGVGDRGVDLGTLSLESLRLHGGRLVIFLHSPHSSNTIKVDTVF